MKKFKVGDEVRLVDGARNIVNNLGDGNVYIIEDIKSDGVKLKGLFPYYHSSLFELVKERSMSKFKVGDKVVRTGNNFGEAIKGGVYEVSEVSDNKYCASTGINLKGHAVEGKGKFNYESSNFDLYNDNILSPLEAAEALLKGDQLEVITTKKGEWQPLDKHQNSVTIKNIKYWKFRHKPKTVNINGVEVVAPVELPRYTEGYTPSLCYKEVQTASAGKGRIMWATEEDAQKALDAMLIPFKQ